MPKGKVDEAGRKGWHWLVELMPKAEVSKGGRKGKG